MFTLGFRTRMFHPYHWALVLAFSIASVAWQTNMAKQRAIQNGFDYAVSFSASLGAAVYTAALIGGALLAGVWLGSRRTPKD